MILFIEHYGQRGVATTEFPNRCVAGVFAYTQCPHSTLSDGVLLFAEDPKGQKIYGECRSPNSQGHLTQLVPPLRDRLRRFRIEDSARKKN